MHLLTQNESKLLERLNAEEKEIFEKYQDCHHELTQIGECEAFIKGFRFGGQIVRKHRLPVYRRNISPEKIELNQAQK